MSADIIPLGPSHVPEVSEIFFETSSKKTFKNEQEKEDFYHKYVGYYLETFPELALVAVFGGKVLGYIVGSTVSNGEPLYRIQPHLEIFEDEFSRFPAHLHINCHASARGKGIGSQLVHALEELLVQNNVKGLHIMTGQNATNQSFYRGLGFDHEVCKDYKGSSILLMGKTLNENKV